VPLDGTPADPRTVQYRAAASPSGRLVHVPISGDERLRLIKSLPSRWSEIMMARERGDTLEQIGRWARVPLNPERECRGECDPPCLRDHMASIYAWLETEINEIAKRRAKLMV
jgi:hypothetical protein